MPRPIKLESIIERIDDKAFFYLSVEEQKLYLTSYTFSILLDFGVSRDFLEGAIPLEELRTKYPLNAEQIEQLKILLEEYQQANEPLLRKTFINISKEELARLNSKVSKLNFALNLFLPSTNGKRNFLTITQSNKILFPARQWRKFLYGLFVSQIEKQQIPSKNEELFELLKGYLLGFYEQVKASEKALLELDGLTYNEVADRHKPRSKPKNNYNEGRDIVIIPNNSILDIFPFLNKGEIVKEFWGGKRLIRKNDFLEVITPVPDTLESINELPDTSILIAKMLVELRAKLYDLPEDNRQGEQEFIIPFHDFIMSMGYAQTQEQAEDKNVRYNFKRKLKYALEYLVQSQVKLVTGRKFNILASYDIDSCVTIKTTGDFSELIFGDKFGREAVWRKLNALIPDNKPILYCLMRKLVNNATNRGKLTKGGSDKLRVQSIFDDLDIKGVLGLNDTTKHAEKRKVERLYKNIVDAELMKILEFHFEGDKEKEIQDEDIAYYLRYPSQFKDLFLIYTIPQLVNFQEFYTDEIYEERQKKIEENKNKRETQKQAKKKQQQPEQDRSPFLDMLDALPKS